MGTGVKQYGSASTKLAGTLPVVFTPSYTPSSHHEVQSLKSAVSFTLLCSNLW